MDNAIKNGISQRRVADHFMPPADGNLAGNHQGTAPVSILDDLEEIAPVIRSQRLGTEVIDNQQ